MAKAARLAASHQSGLYPSKAIVDALLAALAILPALPLLLTIALLIKLDTAGPVLFRQARYGFNGKVFRLYKFRTLFHDRADPLGAAQSHPGDERVTRVGAVLRRAHSRASAPVLASPLHRDAKGAPARPTRPRRRCDYRCCAAARAEPGNGASSARPAGSGRACSRAKSSASRRTPLTMSMLARQPSSACARRGSPTNLVTS
jgi:hypothetical protein